MKNAFFIHATMGIQIRTLHLYTADHSETISCFLKPLPVEFTHFLAADLVNFSLRLTNCETEHTLEGILQTFLSPYCIAYETGKAKQLCTLKKLLH